MYIEILIGLLFYSIPISCRVGQLDLCLWHLEAQYLKSHFSILKVSELENSNRKRLTSQVSDHIFSFAKVDFFE